MAPARDEEGRLAGCLAPLTGDPDLAEIIVVDDDQGVCATRGDLVLFLDADTLPRPELARALAAELSNLIPLQRRAALPINLASGGARQ